MLDYFFGLDAILRTFTRTLTRLERFVERKKQAVSKRNERVTELQMENALDNAERTRAMQVAQKLQELLSL